LANGETASAAKKFGVTPARISQLRLRLKASWDAFQGQATAGQVQMIAARRLNVTSRFARPVALRGGWVVYFFGIRTSKVGH